MILGAGITSKYSLLNARSAGNGNISLDIGVKQIHQGLGTRSLVFRICITSIHSLIADTATFRHPYTGEVVSFRSPWTEITTEGPIGKIDVPF